MVKSQVVEFAFAFLLSRSTSKSCDLLQTKGYAEGAGDSLAGGLKKNVAKVTGDDSKEAEGKH